MRLKYGGILRRSVAERTAMPVPVLGNDCDLSAVRSLPADWLRRDPVVGDDPPEARFLRPVERSANAVRRVVPASQCQPVPDAGVPEERVCCCVILQVHCVLPEGVYVLCSQTFQLRLRLQPRSDSRTERVTIEPFKFLMARRSDRRHRVSVSHVIGEHVLSPSQFRTQTGNLCFSRRDSISRRLNLFVQQSFSAVTRHAESLPARAEPT